jgi:hypothetical protein
MASSDPHEHWIDAMNNLQDDCDLDEDYDAGYTFEEDDSLEYPEDNVNLMHFVNDGNEE